MPRKRMLGASALFVAAGREGREMDRRKFSLAREYPGLPVGRAESFPVQAELCLRATGLGYARPEPGTGAGHFLSLLNLNSEADFPLTPSDRIEQEDGDMFCGQIRPARS